MANLITEKQKKVVKQEYFIRLASMSVFLLSLLGIFLLTYVALYYVSLTRNDSIIADQLKSVIDIENKENVGESVTRLVARTNDQLKTLDLYALDPLVPSVNFEKIINQKNTGIKINRLSFSLIQKKQGQFIVSGIASNRDALVTFIEDLKTTPSFISVESPVSDFARNSNITFTVNIKTKL